MVVLTRPFSTYSTLTDAVLTRPCIWCDNKCANIDSPRTKCQPQIHIKRFDTQTLNLTFSRARKTNVLLFLSYLFLLDYDVIKLSLKEK